ncbi:hypothetical protein O181_050293 [Austropuccinia psidii MF-1]|uniref:Uncharacterized protein n=1 Tax=Austropuccinia psidii MF-1 TaxID=1389203 RepID=A0A9Q3HM83_9BASI|nr:hypothetical protein [Austropuccinia psidii MF-1]
MSTPEERRGSISNLAPKGLPIDFYDLDWFNSPTSGQKRSIQFLPDASTSLLGKPHPDERLSNKQFTALHWEEVIEAYNISHEIQNDNELDTDNSNEVEDLKAEDFGDGEEIKKENYCQSEGLIHLVDEDIEMQDFHSDNTLQQLQNSFFSLPNEWNS